ncbi:MAG TPA: PPE domain-containing protein [Pseudonocardiaceae bacterium]|nr:PPE domain-containing protein [Pseudonocardiaceae bacterium]
MSKHGPRTNFGQYSHQQLYAMLYAGDPNSARGAANGWDSTANALHSQANTLESQLGSFQGNWSGGAANQYTSMVNDLIGGIRKVADTAYKMRDLANDAAGAQETAREQMPAPVDVPAVPAATLALASSPIQVDASTPAAVVAQMTQARAQAVAAVQNQQQVSATADAAHAKAVQVMTSLAGNYVTTQDDIPPAPDAQAVPNVPQNTGGVNGGSSSGVTPITTNLTSFHTGMPTTVTNPIGTTGTPATTTTPNLPAEGAAVEQDSPLFGNMFTAGVAAASAAVFGRFGSIIPKVPGFVGKNKNNGSNPDGSSGSTGSTGTDGSGAPKLGDRAAALGAAKLGGGGGGVGGIGALKSAAIGGGAGGAGSFSGNLLSGANSAGALESGVAAAGSAAGSAAGGTPMMPMMPMSGMGGSDMGGGRRIPPWLMETEDVWNESSPVSPSVIGEE